MVVLSNRHILSNELVQKMDIHIANISMIDSPNIEKMGNCNFLLPDDRYLPGNIKKFINANRNTFTNLEGLLPCSFAQDELEISDKQILDSGIASEKVTIYGKHFYRISEDFIKRSNKKVLNVLDQDDFNDCIKRNLLKDYIKISKNKYLTMY